VLTANETELYRAEKFSPQLNSDHSQVLLCLFEILWFNNLSISSLHTSIFRGIHTADEILDLDQNL